MIMCFFRTTNVPRRRDSDIPNGANPASFVSDRQFAPTTGAETVSRVHVPFPGNHILEGRG